MCHFRLAGHRDCGVRKQVKSILCNLERATKLRRADPAEVGLYSNQLTESRPRSENQMSYGCLYQNPRHDFKPL